MLEVPPKKKLPTKQPRARGARGAAAVVRFKQWTPAQWRQITARFLQIESK